MLTFTALLGLFGCGGAPPPDADAAFAAIQVHEATIAHRSADAAECAPTGSCPPTVELCEAAEALCEVAGNIDDTDALERCALARRRCGEHGGARP